LNGPAVPPALEAYPLRVAYDAQAIIVPDLHIGKGIHLRNLLGPYITRFTGLAPKGTYKTELPIVQEGCSNYLFWQQISLSRLLFSRKPDVFVAPFNTAPLLIPKPTKLILVVHDLITFQKYPNVGRRFRLLLGYWSALTSASIRQSFLVITVSQYSRQEILRRFPKAQVKVLPNTIEESWYVRNDAVPLRDRANYILVVSAMSPHKNLDRGLQAYARYAQQAGKVAADLKVVGISKSNADRLDARVRALGLRDRVHFLPYLSVIELQQIYRNAKALFLPSLMEGFGIPLLEAMASGTPVISSSSTSLPEVGGNAPRYFDPHNVTDISSALVAVLADDKMQAEMAERGLARAEIYHPSAVREQIERFWNELPRL
jgi:glycosyltransferase involved in cell wall biosynthesis